MAENLVRLRTTAVLSLTISLDLSCSSCGSGLWDFSVRLVKDTQDTGRVPFEHWTLYDLETFDELFFSFPALAVVGPSLAANTGNRGRLRKIKAFPAPPRSKGLLNPIGCPSNKHPDRHRLCFICVTRKHNRRATGSFSRWNLVMTSILDHQPPNIWSNFLSIQGSSAHRRSSASAMSALSMPASWCKTRSPER